MKMNIKVRGKNTNIFKLICRKEGGLDYEKITSLKEKHGYKWSPKAPSRLLFLCCLDVKSTDEVLLCYDYLLSLGADINYYDRGGKSYASDCGYRE